jgi:hypothetical protein
VVVSMMTTPKPVSELNRLVMGVTDIPSEQQVSLLHRPAFWAVAVAVVFVIFNVVFW